MSPHYTLLGSAPVYRLECSLIDDMSSCLKDDVWVSIVSAGAAIDRLGITSPSTARYWTVIFGKVIANGDGNHGVEAYLIQRR
ncbi:hypothetical protein Tco_1129223 [Tanacetum coccineum]